MERRAHGTNADEMEREKIMPIFTRETDQIIIHCVILLSSFAVSAWITTLLRKK